jgi:NADPH-dependent glutamate synthase beta subunit-like oxidoreductase
MEKLHMQKVASPSPSPSPPKEEERTGSAVTDSITSKKKPKNIIKHEIEIMEIRGIPYFVDTFKNVYHHETINDLNPQIVGRLQ